jgi:hypothetical protein
MNADKTTGLAAVGVVVAATASLGAWFASRGERFGAVKRAWVTRAIEEYNPGCVKILATPIPQQQFQANLDACLSDENVDPDTDDERESDHAPLRYECDDDLSVLRDRFPEIRGVYVVTGSASTLPGEGGGLAMYETLLKHTSERSYAVAPHRCSTKGSTSEAAGRVWDALKRRGYPHEGDVIWGKR